MSALRSGWDSVAGRGPEFSHQPPGRHVEPRGLGGYWLDLRHKSYAADAAPDGLPRGADGRELDWVVPLAQAALGYWERRCEGEETGDRFLSLAERLLATGRPAVGGLRWEVPVAAPKYGLGRGWPSALGQGQAISVLLRAGALTGEERWAAAAHAALAPLAATVEDGGLARVLNGALVLEEYPSRRPCAVLNGWIYALLGVHELAVTGEPRAEELVARSTHGLLALLPRYDLGWWSRYSLYPHGRSDLAKPFYQRLHPVLLEALHLARPDPRLPAMAARWRAQLTPLTIARASVDKLVFRADRAFREHAGHAA